MIARSLRAINASLVEAIQASSGDDEKLEGLIENVAAVFERTGHARVVLWLALEGHRIDSAEARLFDVVDAAHALRLARKKGGRKSTREDTAYTVVLAALALVGGAVIGGTLLENAGLGEGAGVAADFRRWLARVLIEHLDDG